MVARAGAGPEPCPVDDLTADILAEKLQTLMSEDIIRTTKELSAQMNAENGILTGLGHFAHSLPRDSMMCDVSLIMGESTKANWQVIRSRISICYEVAAMTVTEPLEYIRMRSFDDLCYNFNMAFKKGTLHLARFIDPGHKDNIRTHSATTYALSVGQDSFIRSATGACCECLRISMKGFCQCFLRPDKLSYAYGLCGCIIGGLTYPFFTVGYLIKALIVCIDRIGVGIANSCFGRQWLYFIDSTTTAKVYQCPESTGQNSLFEYQKTMSKKRLAEIASARMIADSAMSIWLSCKPEYTSEHWHWKEVLLSRLKSALLDNGRTSLGFTDVEFAKLMNRLDKYEKQKDEEIKGVPAKDKKPLSISFSRFCLFIGEAVHLRYIESSESEEIRNENSELGRMNATVVRISNNPKHLDVFIPIDSELGSVKTRNISQAVVEEV